MELNKVKRLFAFTVLSVTLAAVLCALPSCSKKTSEKPKYLWMCIDANFERFSSKDSINFYLDKALETGFNSVVVDVRGVEGSVLYDSDFLPKLIEVKGYECDREWDYLQYFISQAKKREMKVCVSATVFPAGSPWWHTGPVYEDSTLSALTCLEYTPEGMKKIENDPGKVAAFMNPILPESRAYAMRMLKEIFEKYDFNAFCLDYCRFPDAESDFSEASKLAFEKYIGEKVENFPEDIFTYGPAGERIPGKYYKEWWEFRSMSIRDFVAEVREMKNKVRPDVELQYWAASWLHAIYTQGQNWASPRSDFHKQYENDWATPTYNNTGFADLLDTFITGTYLEKVWGMDDPESIEFGIARTIRDINGDCKVYGSIYAQNKENFEDAVYLSLSRTEGLMIFDIVQVIGNSLWDDIKAGIDRAEAEM